MAALERLDHAAQPCRVTRKQPTDAGRCPPQGSPRPVGGFVAQAGRRNRRCREQCEICRDDAFPHRTGEPEPVQAVWIFPALVSALRQTGPAFIAFAATPRILSSRATSVSRTHPGPTAGEFDSLGAAAGVVRSTPVQFEADPAPAAASRRSDRCRPGDRTRFGRCTRQLHRFLPSVHDPCCRNASLNTARTCASRGSPPGGRRSSAL